MKDPNFSDSHNTGGDVSPCNPQEGTQTASDALDDLYGHGAEAALTISPPSLERADGNTGPAASVEISNESHNIDSHVASPYNWRAHRLPPTPPLTLIARQVHTKDAEAKGPTLMRDEIGQSKMVSPAEGTSSSRIWCASYASKALKDWSPPVRYADPELGGRSRYLLLGLKINFDLVANLRLWVKSRSRSSKIFVQLADHINDWVVALRPYHIDMSSLHVVNDELREVLETCLALDATPEDIELYLPTIRKILTKVVQVGQPIYHSSQQTYEMKQINVEIQPRIANRIEVTSEVVSLDNDQSSLGLRAYHCQDPNIPFISGMHNCALSLLRNLELWGSLRTKICDAFIETFTAFIMDTDDLQSLAKDLCALLLQCLAADAIPEDVSNLLPNILAIARELSQKFKERNGPYRECFSAVSTASTSSSGHRIATVTPGRHVHLVKGSERPRVRPRPPQILQTEDREYVPPTSQPAEEGGKLD